MVPTSVSNYISGVRVLHIFHGYPFIRADEFLLQLELRGISRLDPHVPVRAIPVTPAILLAFYQHMDKHESLHCSVWACSLFLFFTMARLGSILPKTKTTLPHTVLTRDRVNFSKEGILVTLLHTKTIQFGRRRLHIPLIRINSVLCPVRAFEGVLAHVQGPPAGPAFVFLKQGSVQWLTGPIFIRTFRSVLKVSGAAHAKSFTGHSFCQLVCQLV